MFKFGYHISDIRQSDMTQMRTVELLHPVSDGADRKESFLVLLREAIRSISRDGGPVDLRSVQSVLLQKGWHP